jgi:hypothetical protein
MLNVSQYGLNSVHIFADVGGVYLNFGLWAVALLPGWLVVRQIGVTLGNKKVERESQAFRENRVKEDAKDAKSSGVEA